MLFGKLDATYAFEVARAFPWMLTPVHLWRFAACCDFAWNLGGPNFRASGMRTALARKDWIAAAENCKLWCLSGGRRIAHLVYRRGVESRMLLKDYAGESD
jgi:GH24 family phage-related lysozyme (muramidase)